MRPFYKEYFACLQKLHEDIERSMEGLPQDALDWIPGHGMNSICVLVVHLTGAERYWIGDVVAGEASERDRQAEFAVLGLEVEDLIGRLADSLAYARGVLEKLTLQDLKKTCISPMDGRRFTVAWALAHALEHTALHVGHIQITRQLWEQRAAI